MAVSIHGKLLLCVGAALLPQLSSGATCTTTACRAPIVRLYVNGTSVAVELSLTEGQKDALPCTLTDDAFFTLVDTNTGRKEIYAALLSAQARGADVTLRVVGDSANNCQIVWAMAWS